MSDLIERQKAIDELISEPPEMNYGFFYAEKIKALPSEQPQYTELTPEEAASKIASGSIMSASYWLNFMIQLKQMGYAVCRKNWEENEE